ncbi:MAG: glycosyltransferase [Acidobacteriota bacterium]|nr:glycosyltransferase [Acidobacteriota bacterium]
MDHGLDLSVVISTYNRCDMLPAAIESVLRQETDGVRYELIVVDNNSSDRTREVVESLMARGAGNLRYVFEGRQGLSHARNAGISEARSPLIAFTDDDVRAAPDWVVSIKRAFDSHPEVDFVGGKVLPQWESEPPPWLTRKHWAPLAIVDYGDEPFYVDMEKPLCLVGANLSIRRDLFGRVGLFNPDLQRVKDGVGSMEDHEFLLRAWKAGRRGLYVPGIVMHAEVQTERMKKDYHRRWHTGHGHFYAIMRAEDIERGDARLFDVPAHLYRQALKNWACWLAERLRGNEDLALECENEVRFFKGFFRQRHREFKAMRPRSTAREVALFAQSLVSSVLHRKVRRES